VINQSSYYLIGFASGLAGVAASAGDGPIVIQQSQYLANIINRGIEIKWHDMIKPPIVTTQSLKDVLKLECTTLATAVSHLVGKKQQLCVVGGDHAAALGTWSGVYHSIHEQGDLGLIWVDAHMDSHTPETSESGRIHGMPLACLLGYGYSEFTTILDEKPKVKPENICLIGVRSYEAGEAEFLKRLGVRIYFMDEIKQRGFNIIWAEAVALVSKNTFGYGVSIDVDAFDPSIAPGVDVPEPDGLFLDDFLPALSTITNDPKLLATEIVELDPSRDQQTITEKLVVAILEVLAKPVSSS